MYHPAVRTVTPIENYKLIIEFRDGVTKLFDVKPLIDSREAFKELNDVSLFNKVYSTPRGWGIVWNDNIDIEAYALYRDGVIMSSKFDGLVALGDAADIWEMDDSTLRRAIQSGKLKVGIDVTKYGKQWVVSMEAMVREYGEPKH